MNRRQFLQTGMITAAAHLPVIRHNNAITSSSNWWLAGDIPLSASYTVYDAIGAAWYETSVINQANPGTRDATGNAPSLEIGAGWRFAGGQYLDTGAVVGGNHTVLIWCDDTPHNAGYVGNVLQTIPSPVRRFGIRPYVVNDIRFERGGGAVSIPPNVAGGVVGIAGNRPVLNGRLLDTTLPTWSGGETTIPLYIGANNVNGNPQTFYTGLVRRVAIYDRVLTEEQITAVCQAMTDIPHHAYIDRVLATKPSIYWPLNEATGWAGDWTSNGRYGMVQQAEFMQPGKYGLAMRFNRGLNSVVESGYLAADAINMSEYSAAAWVYLANGYQTGEAVRLFNVSNPVSSEYSVAEIRTTDKLSVFLKAAGQTQTIGPLATVSIGEWFHVVQFNSESEGVAGVYLNGQLYEATRTIPGTTSSLFAGFPNCWFWLDGLVQHAVWYDHKLTQPEVDALL